MIDGGLSYHDIARFLDVSIKTVEKWFKGKSTKHNNRRFVDLSDFCDFLSDYRDGRYLKKMLEKGNFDESIDDDELARLLLQTIFDNCKVYIDVDTLDFSSWREHKDISKIIKPKGIEVKVVYC